MKGALKQHPCSYQSIGMTPWMVAILRLSWALYKFERFLQFHKERFLKFVPFYNEG